MSGADRNAVLELVRGKISDILEVDASDIPENATFIDDLDADSLAIIELVESLEQSLQETNPGFRVDDEDLLEITTVGQAVDYIIEHT